MSAAGGDAARLRGTFGISPTGKSFTAEHMHWHRLAEGKLAERWAVRDELDSLIQLGIIDPPGPRTAVSPKVLFTELMGAAILGSLTHP